MDPKTRDKIVETLSAKSVMKQNVYEQALNGFKTLKLAAQAITTDLKTKMETVDQRVSIEFLDCNEFECRIKFGGDVLVFHLHTNVFKPDQTSAVYKSSYVKNDPYNAYSGIIHIYNFLADSIKYNRENDLGYLVARVHINKEGHFYVEGKGVIGVLFNDLMHEQVSEARFTQLVESCMEFALGFDLLTPPYAQVSQISLYEIKELAINQKLKTGKRLGFTFSYEDDEEVK